MENSRIRLVVGIAGATLLTICLLDSIRHNNYESVTVDEASNVYGGVCWVRHINELLDQCDPDQGIGNCGRNNHPRIEQWTQGGNTIQNAMCNQVWGCEFPIGPVTGWCSEPT